MLEVAQILSGYRGSAEILSTVLRALKPKPDLLVWEWADKRRKLNRKHAKEAGRWSTDRVPFMREPMECLSPRSPVRRVVFMKGSQVSGTETANNWTGFTIDHDPSSLLYICPTLSVTKRTSARIQAMVDDDPDGLGQKIKPSRIRDAKNSQLEKHFDGGALYFATAASAANLSSTAVGKIIFDEVDRFPRDVGDEGGVVEVAEARAFTFEDELKLLLVSTPTIDQTSIIKPEYLKGDQRIYMMRCPHPGCRRHISFRKEGFAWTTGKPETVHYVCDHCAKPIIDVRHKTAMMAKGVWVPKKLHTNVDSMARLDGGDRSELDAFNRTSLRRSYHLPSFYSPIGWLSWKKIIERWEEAEGLPHKMKAVVNTIFGDTFVEAGEAPDWEMVYGRRDLTYRQREIPKDVVFLTAGADVGHDHVEVSVWGWGRRRRRYMIEHVRIDGAPNEPGTWDQVSAVLQRVYRHPCGAYLPLRKFGIDRRTFDAYVDPWVAEQNAKVVHAVQGSDFLDTFHRWSKRREKPTADTEVHAARFNFLTVGSSFTKLDFYGALQLRLTEGKEPPAGWVSLPADVTEDYVKQLVSERLSFEEKNGRRSGKGKWVGIGATRHEALDCAVYARCMASLIGWDRWSEADFAREEAALLASAQELASLREIAARENAAPPIAPIGLVLPAGKEEGMIEDDAEEEGAAQTVRRIDVDAARSRSSSNEDIAPQLLPDRQGEAGDRRRWGRRRQEAAPGVVGCSPRKSAWRDAMLAPAPADDDD